MNRRILWCVGRGLAGLLFALAVQAGIARAATITVTTMTDEFGSGPACSLREAVRTANGNADFGSCAHIGAFGSDLILVPPGTYELTIAGIDEDADATADLDILGNVTISATGSTPTIRGDSGGYSGRLVHVHSPAVATIKNVTLGIASVPGGRAGGCVRVEIGASLVLLSTNVTNCSANGNAGGILNMGTLTITGGQILTNTTAGADGGGGIFVDNGATLYISNTRIAGNSATAVLGLGAGIYCDSSSRVTIVDSTVERNTAAEGAGLYCNGGSATIQRSTFRLNNGQLNGGMYFSGGGTTVIEDSLVANNNAIKTDPTDTVVVLSAGGISYCCGSLTIRRSIIRDNIARNDRVENNTVRGGGLNVGGGTVLIENSTISGNSVSGSLGDSEMNGGGIIGLTGGAGRITLVNSTVSGNSAEGSGGGIWVDENFHLDLRNATIFGNSGTDGGGLRLTSGSLVTLTNSVVAGNVDTGSNNRDDCFGGIDLVSFGHVQNTTGCSFGVGVPTTGSSGLAGLANNGGTTAGDSGSAETPKTHRPNAGSILIDTGDNAGCKNASGATLTSDERGLVRPSNSSGVSPRCDIGAVELHYPAFTLNATGSPVIVKPGTAPGSALYTTVVQNTDSLTVTSILVTRTLSLFMQWDTFPASCVKDPYYVLECALAVNVPPGNSRSFTGTASFIAELASGACGMDFALDELGSVLGFDGAAAQSFRTDSASTRLICPRAYMPVVFR